MKRGCCCCRRRLLGGVTQGAWNNLDCRTLPPSTLSVPSSHASYMSNQVHSTKLKELTTFLKVTLYSLLVKYTFLKDYKKIYLIIIS